MIKFPNIIKGQKKRKIAHKVKPPCPLNEGFSSFPQSFPSMVAFYDILQDLMYKAKDLRKLVYPLRQGLTLLDEKWHSSFTNIM